MAKKTEIKASSPLSSRTQDVSVFFEQGPFSAIKQLSFIEAFQEDPSDEKAAIQAAGIVPKTLQNWKKNCPHFVEEINRIYKDYGAAIRMTGASAARKFAEDLDYMSEQLRGEDGVKYASPLAQMHKTGMMATNQLSRNDENANKPSLTINIGSFKDKPKNITIDASES